MGRQRHPAGLHRFTLGAQSHRYTHVARCFARGGTESAASWFWEGMPGAQGSNEASASELEMDVYWASSRVMRAASARRAILHGGKTDVDVDKYASQPQEEYQIVMQSEDMTPFVRHDEKFFQANSFLEPKKSKQKIAPSHVVYERGEKSQVSAAVFFFPKKTASGE